MAARNGIEFTIPLTLGDGRTVQTVYCKLTADALEGYGEDGIHRGDEILLDFIIGSGGGITQTTRIAYRVTHAHPDSYQGRGCTWFMAVPPS